MTQLEQRDDVVFSVFRKGSHLAAGVHWQKCIKAEGEFVLQLTKKSYSLVGRFRDSIYVCNKVVSEQYRRIDKIGSTPNCDQTSPSICLILWLWHGPFKLGKVILGDLVLPLKSVHFYLELMVIDFLFSKNVIQNFTSNQDCQFWPITGGFTSHFWKLKKLLPFSKILIVVGQNHQAVSLSWV